MAERILVSTELMLQTMQQYENNKNKQMIAYLQLYRTVHSLDGVWVGAAHDVFIERFEALYNNISQSEERMQDAVNELRSSSDIFQAAEDDIKGEASGLDAGSRFQA